MNRPLIIAAVCAGLPACAGQDAVRENVPDAERHRVSATVHCETPGHPAPASGALPARASTGPEPQRGTVAPSTRVASHVVTPSMRAMEKARAAQEAQQAGNEKKLSNSCEPAPAATAPKRGVG